MTLSIYFHILRVQDHLSVISLVLSHFWEENKVIYKINRHQTITIQQIQIMLDISNVMPEAIAMIKNVADRTVAMWTA